MNGELAQLVALVAHARAALFGDGASVEASSPTFGAVNSFVFELEEGEAYRSVAASPREWWEYLAGAGCRDLRLSIGKPVKALHPHVRGALPDGSRWLAIATHDGEERAWYGSWDIVKGAPKDKPWAVRYRDFACVPVTGLAADVAAASAKLGAALRAIEAVAREGELEGWSKLFAAALSDLESPGAALNQAGLLPSAGYTEEAQRLLSACHRADVFGGMGSWNDVEFDDSALRRRYGEVTPVLHDAVRQGLVAAVNGGLRGEG